MAKKTYIRPSVTTFQVEGSMLMQQSTIDTIGVSDKEAEAWEDACAPTFRDLFDDTDDKGDTKWGW